MKCVRCGGTGKEQDSAAVGQTMKNRRLSAELSLRQMAVLVGRSHSFLSQLENGRRRWPEFLLNKYAAACNERNE
jgi:transcriptional regulator with XRE-family HTH domain